MKVIKFNGHILEMYNSIAELNIERYQAYSLGLLIDAGVGSDAESVDNKIVGLLRLMDLDVNNAKKELSNLQQTFRFIVSNTSPKFNSFVPMIHKLNGRLITSDDLTETGTAAVLKELSDKGLSVAKISNYFNFLKKKIDLELEMFFPKSVNHTPRLQFYSNLKEQTVLTLKAIQGFDVSAQMRTIDAYFNSLLKPKMYFGTNGAIVQMIKNFETTCLILQQNNISLNPKLMTVLQFNEALFLIKEQNKKNGKSN